MIIPAILEKTWEDIERKLEISSRFASTVHIDFIDGDFVDNKNFLNLERFADYKQRLNLEAHLMVKEPIKYLDDLNEAGFSKFLGHVEHMTDQVEFVAKGEGMGSVGLAIDIDTSIDKIKVSLEDLDQILLMSVKAGKSGQKFNNSVLPKIEKLRKKYFGKIEIDGGINSDTLRLAKKAGADDFCVTSALFKEDPKDEYEKLIALL